MLLASDNNVCSAVSVATALGHYFLCAVLAIAYFFLYMNAAAWAADFFGNNFSAWVGMVNLFAYQVVC